MAASRALLPHSHATATPARAGPASGARSCRRPRPWRHRSRSRRCGSRGPGRTGRCGPSRRCWWPRS
uniref:Uncharacterized protein n=1 Tax=Arundo donax TaxID=35708 RepID=A0A0A8Z353_ARUDO